VKSWPLRNRVSFWTACLLTVELILFGVASGWMIYQEGARDFCDPGLSITSLVDLIHINASCLQAAHFVLFLGTCGSTATPP